MTRTHLPAAGVVLAILSLAGSGCGRGNAHAATAGDSTMFVGRENLTVAEQETLLVGPAIAGTLAAERSATVRAEVGGALLEVRAEPGQPVARGQVLGRIDDTGLRDAYTSAQSALQTAELNAGLARRNAERSRALAEAGAIADRDREQAEWTLSSAESQAADARSRLATAEKALGKTVLRAPFSGVVSERPANLGDIVQTGNPLFTVVDPSALKLEGTVATDALKDLAVGASVLFTVTGLEEPLRGRITRINPAVDPATGQVRVTVGIPNGSGRLVAGLFADGRVATSSRVGVVVPSEAVDRKGLRPFVVRVRQGKVERVEVTLGLIDAAEERMEVTSGLAPGDTLLLGGARGIAPGLTVQVGAAAEKE